MTVIKMHKIYDPACRHHYYERYYKIVTFVDLHRARTLHMSLYLRNELSKTFTEWINSDRTLERQYLYSNSGLCNDVGCSIKH